MKLRPIKDKIIVKVPKKTLENTTKSGIITYNEEPSINEEWVIESVGPEVTQVKPWDKITFIRTGDQTNLELKDYALAICAEKDVIWILN